MIGGYAFEYIRYKRMDYRFPQYIPTNLFYRKWTSLKLRQEEDIARTKGNPALAKVQRNSAIQ